MTLLGTAAAVGLWLLAAVAVYAVLAGVVLFFLPPAEELPNGTVVDGAFAFTLPLVLATTWLATLRRR